jgi:glycosyl transferase family 25
MHQKNGFELLNDYFDKIYVISIERNFDARHPKLSDNLKGLNYEIFNGVDGKDLIEESVQDIYDDRIARNKFSDYCLYSFGHRVERSFSKSEIGCAKSHLNIYKEIIEKGYQKVLIFEDDAKIVNDNIHLISEIIDQIPENCDLLYWGYRWYDSESKLSRFKRLFLVSPISLILNLFRRDKVNLNERYPKPFKKHVWKSGYHCGAHAYSINFNTAKKLLDYNSPIIMLADQLFAEMNREGDINAYVTVPLIFREDQTMISSIVEKK